MTQIRTVQRIRIAEHRRRLFERDAVLGAVDGGFPRVPFEHDSVYTKPGAPTVEPDGPEGGLFIGRCVMISHAASHPEGVRCSARALGEETKALVTQGANGNPLCKRSISDRRERYE